MIVHSHGAVFKFNLCFFPLFPVLENTIADNRLKSLKSKLAEVRQEQDMLNDAMAKTSQSIKGVEDRDRTTTLVSLQPPLRASASIFFFPFFFLDSYFLQ